jgi:hypothetical protein
MDLKRRAAAVAYKERKTVAGVFALRCRANEQSFVGRALDIDKIRNRLVFSLNGGSHPQRELQAAWTRFGEAAFAFEILERLELASSAYVRDAALRDRVEFWRARLVAASA